MSTSNKYSPEVPGTSGADGLRAPRPRRISITVAGHEVDRAEDRPYPGSTAPMGAAGRAGPWESGRSNERRAGAAQRRCNASRKRTGCCGRPSGISLAAPRRSAMRCSRSRSSCGEVSPKMKSQSSSCPKAPTCSSSALWRVPVSRDRQHGRASPAPGGGHGREARWIRVARQRGRTLAS